jgi:hypothetical protein
MRSTRFGSELFALKGPLMRTAAAWALSCTLGPSSAPACACPPHVLCRMGWSACFAACGMLSAGCPGMSACGSLWASRAAQTTCGIGMSLVCARQRRQREACWKAVRGPVPVHARSPCCICALGRRRSRERCVAVQGNCRWISSTQHCVTRPALVSATEYTRVVSARYTVALRWYTMVYRDPSAYDGGVAWRGVAWRGVAWRGVIDQTSPCRRLQLAVSVRQHKLLHVPATADPSHSDLRRSTGAIPSHRRMPARRRCTLLAAQPLVSHSTAHARVRVHTSCRE